MKPRYIIIYWLLLFVPALIMSGAAFGLLKHEQDRLNQAAREAIIDRTRTIAETIVLAVQAVEDELVQSLFGIDADKLVDTLQSWEAENPLIRNTFIFAPKTGFIYPDPGTVDKEKTRFIARYRMLFADKSFWTDTKDFESETQVQAKAASAPQKTGGRLTYLSRARTARQSLVDLAKKGVAQPRPRTSDQMPATRLKQGFIPWFADNRLQLLGWVQQKGLERLYGVELEMMTLLSRLVVGFPENVLDSTVIALVDGQGNILHQTGNAVGQADGSADLSIPLSPTLPHWRVAVYISGDTSSGRGFLILSSLLLGIFLMAMLAGGGMLAWQAYRQMIEARQKTSFVSNVSHELKTPLTSIRMYAELLAEGRVKNSEKSGQYLKVIVDESQRLTRLVNNVLDFSRLEQDRKEYNIQDLDLKDYLKEFLTIHGAQAEQAGLKLKIFLPDSPAIIRTDRDAVEQILLNILDNACKYAAGGKELSLTLETGERGIIILIRDKGPGVPASHQKKIFNKFYRADDSLISNSQGSGLGLSIARRLARDLGGDVTFEPDSGGGSCFMVNLPYDDAG